MDVDTRIASAKKNVDNLWGGDAWIKYSASTSNMAETLQWLANNGFCTMSLARLKYTMSLAWMKPSLLLPR